jgi:pimeloyl-ACP methyl ester carboxylesterase
MWLVKLALILVALYLTILAVAYFAQTALLFPTSLAGTDLTVLPQTARRLTVDTPEGERLAGVLLPRTQISPNQSPLILGFGGNAWNAYELAVYLQELFPGADVIAFQYRGYPPSTGRPSAAALLADALIIHDQVVQQFGQEKMVAVGFSIGAGAAAYLAANRRLLGVILVTPFDSLRKLAQEHYPWLPVGWLLRHKMETIDFMRGSDSPSAVIAAERDTIIPSRRTEALRREIPRLVFDRVLAGAGHNDIYNHPDFVDAMTEALMRIEAGHTFED